MSSTITWIFIWITISTLSLSDPIIQTVWKHLASEQWGRQWWCCLLLCVVQKFQDPDKTPHFSPCFFMTRLWQNQTKLPGSATGSAVSLACDITFIFQLFRVQVWEWHHWIPEKWSGSFLVVQTVPQLIALAWPSLFQALCSFFFFFDLEDSVTAGWGNLFFTAE